MKKIVLTTLALLIARVSAPPRRNPNCSNQTNRCNSRNSPWRNRSTVEAQPMIDRRNLALPARPNLLLTDVNTDIGVDRRVIVMMAALNVAGYDYESGARQFFALRLLRLAKTGRMK